MNTATDHASLQWSFLYVLLITAVAALGGLLFGCDTPDISGVIGFLEQHYELLSFMKRWGASSVRRGCMAGVVVVGVISDQMGFRRTSKQVQINEV